MSIKNLVPTRCLFCNQQVLLMKSMAIILINICKNTSSPYAAIKPPTLRMTMASPTSRLRILQGSTLESQELKMRYCMRTLRSHSMSFMLYTFYKTRIHIKRTSNRVHSDLYLGFMAFGDLCIVFFLVPIKQ